MLQRYNRRDDLPRMNACCLRCPCLLRARIVGARCPSFALSPSSTHGTPGIRECPTIFCTHMDISPLHRYLNRVSGTETLPWHHFYFHHGDKCFIMLLSTFNKTCIKLEHVIRIMLTTFECLKLLFALIY